MLIIITVSSDLAVKLQKLNVKEKGCSILKKRGNDKRGGVIRCNRSKRGNRTPLLTMLALTQIKDADRKKALSTSLVNC